MDFRIANWIYRVHRVAPADFDMGSLIFLNGFPKYDTILYIMKNWYITRLITMMSQPNCIAKLSFNFNFNLVERWNSLIPTWSSHPPPPVKVYFQDFFWPNFNYSFNLSWDKYYQFSFIQPTPTQYHHPPNHHYPTEIVTELQL